MPTVYMLVGIPGSGKSFIAEEMADKAVIVSSDKTRERILGDVNDQSQNAKVFGEMRAQVVSLLKAGVDVIYDATNINRKRRIGFIKDISQAVPDKVRFVAKVVATKIETCLENNASRDRKVPKEVILRMVRNFQIPTKDEGFDSIEVVYPFEEAGSLDQLAALAINGIKHDNPHHTLRINDHMDAARKYFFKNKDKWGKVSDCLCNTILLHDIGKAFCKTFTNMKGETTNIAHYYGHDSYGAYLSLFIPLFLSGDVLYRAQLICYHMQPYFGHKGATMEEKYDGMLKKFGGDEKFVRELMILHECDLNAH